MNLNSILIFLLLNFFWIIILYLSLGVFYKKKNPALLYVFFFVFAIIAIVLSITIVLDYTESDGFCANICHPMEDYGNSLEDSEEDTILGNHRENDVGCSDCHTEPGIDGFLKAKYSGMVEVYKFAFGKYEEPLHHPEVGKEFCAKSGCHDDVDWLIQGVENNETSDGMIEHPDMDENEICNECHAPHQDGMKLKPEGCTVCHNVTEDDLFNHEDFVVKEEQFLEIIENITEVDTCSDCHENMDKIPYKSTTPNEFCQSCHDNEFIAYTENFTVNQTAFYGGCVDCHSEHKEKQELHPTLPEIDCEDCHTNYGEEITIHNPSELSYESVASDLNNEFCSSCHEEEFNAYKGNITYEQIEFYGEDCVDCHLDHDEIKEIHPIIEDIECKNCHTTYDDEIKNHNPSGISYKTEVSRFNNDFCSSCHEEELNAYKGNITSEQLEFYGEDCVDCHSDHDEEKEIHTIPEKLNCLNCHTNYNEEIKTHDPSEISYKSVSSQLNNDFCQKCHEKEFNDFQKQLGTYGDCVNCHSDHDVKTLPHPDVESLECKDCHENYGDDIHDPTNVNYGTIQLENEFCNQCHEKQYEQVKTGSLEGYMCVECHNNHTVTVSEEKNCGNCHSDFSNNHNP